MDRRKFIQLITSGALGAYVIDSEKLLWVPGEKTIFLPPVKVFKPGIDISKIIALELERIAPHLQSLFEKDDVFYATISKFEELDRGA